MNLLNSLVLMRMLWLNLVIILIVMRKILIPTDFSENAMNALKYATELFKYEISEFYIMNTYQEESYSEVVLPTQGALDIATSKISKTSNEQLQIIKKDIITQVKIEKNMVLQKIAKNSNFDPIEYLKKISKLIMYSLLSSSSIIHYEV